MEKIRDQRAHELGIDPTLIAPKSVLGDLARDWDKHAPELMNWQRELLAVKASPHFFKRKALQVFRFRESSG